MQQRDPVVHPRIAGRLIEAEDRAHHGIGETGGYRDLAFYFDFGAGSLDVDRDIREDGSGGFTSILGLGSAYELWRLGSFAFGPNANYSHQWSQTSSSHFATLGLRAVFYGGPS